MIRYNKRYISIILVLVMVLAIIMPCLKVKADVDYMAEAEARKYNEVQSNLIQDWPQGPQIGAEAAILMEASTGTVLYAKEITKKEYPASVTKVMTGLLAAENCDLDEMVTFSHEAVFGIERGSSNIGMDEGESITMNDALHGMLILSANEVAMAIGEHIAGDKDSFAELMNQRAAELGCVNTHFMNACGLHDDNHYTCAYDLALIAREFYTYDYLAKISRTGTCTFEATATQPDSFSLQNKNQLLEGRRCEYEGLLGSKTGYTTVSRQTLVSAAERDGMTLICVILKEESPYQFEDTVALFDYGFENFQLVNVAENESEFMVSDKDFFSEGQDIFGDNQPFLQIDPDDYVVIPKTADFSALQSEIVYNSNATGGIADIKYTFNGTEVGTATVLSADADGAKEGNDKLFSEGNPIEIEGGPTTNDNALFLNIKWIIVGVVVVVLVVSVILIAFSILKEFHFERASGKRRVFKFGRKRSHYKSRYKGYKLKDKKFK